MQESDKPSGESVAEIRHYNKTCACDDCRRRRSEYYYLNRDRIREQRKRANLTPEKVEEQRRRERERYHLKKQEALKRVSLSHDPKSQESLP